MITIFTPTYNRAHTLPKLYESLKNQNSKNFEWLIVDDGSIDETKELIDKYIAEKEINIRYFFQENKGKHLAINKGISIATSDYFLVIDSDDCISVDCIDICSKMISEIRESDFDGFTFIRFSESSNFNRELYGKKRWRKGQSYIWEFNGEMMYCIKTDVYKRFLFPEFPGEKFCPESLILRRLEEKHSILYTDYVLAFGDYLDGGLTKNYYMLMFNNPHGALLNYKERIHQSKDFNQKFSFAKNYYDIAWKSSKTTLKEKYFNLNPLLTIAVFWDTLKR